MPEMGTGLETNNSTVVSAFQSALLHQALIVLGLLSLFILAWTGLRAATLRRAITAHNRATPSMPETVLPAEPLARHFLRISFGLLWILDGILQGQTAMPLGMTSQVVKPAAAASPAWVQHLVNAGATIWNDHPIHMAAATVWVQIGVGLLLLVAARGSWSRLAGVVSVAWAVVVWIFGEAFGGIFAPGLTWMFGAPGAVVFYAAAGVLIALPERTYERARLGRIVLFATGAFFLSMAVLQAWPGRGFWQGRSPNGTSAGALDEMVQQMAQISQPRVLSSLLAHFGAFDGAHGFAVNLFVVVALGTVGATLLSGRTQLIRFGVAAGAILCLADWVLVEDFGFFGGVGTDPNSMIPMVLIFLTGYLALTGVPVSVHADTPANPPAPSDGHRGWFARSKVDPAYALRILAGLGAIGVVLVGAVPMAAASVNPNADPIVAEAIGGTPNVTDGPAPGFDLLDQHGRAVSLARLHGKAIALTFLDPVCTSDCPIIAQEFRQADALLGGAARGAVFIAVVANPIYRSTAVLQAFDRTEGLDHIANWLYLTGSPSQLRATWDRFGIQVSVEPGGAMVAHNDLAYVIDPSGHVRYILNTDPGPGSQAIRSSFAGELASELRSTLPRS